MLNFMNLKSGQRLRLRDGRTGEVIDNIGDGIWVQVRIDGEDEEGELVHCEEAQGLVEQA